MHLGALTPRVTYGLTNGQALSGVGHRDASTYKTAKIKLSCWLNFNSTLVMTCLCLTFDFSSTLVMIFFFLFMCSLVHSGPSILCLSQWELGVGE